MPFAEDDVRTTSVGGTRILLGDCSGFIGEIEGELSGNAAQLGGAVIDGAEGHA